MWTTNSVFGPCCIALSKYQYNVGHIHMSLAFTLWLSPRSYIPQSIQLFFCNAQPSACHLLFACERQYSVGGRKTDVYSRLYNFVFIQAPRAAVECIYFKMLTSRSRVFVHFCVFVVRVISLLLGVKIKSATSTADPHFS